MTKPGPTRAERAQQVADLQADILAAMRARPDGIMTYVVGNILRWERRRQCTTAQIRYALRKLEMAGKVRQVSTSYATQLCWALVPGAN